MIGATLFHSPVFTGLVFTFCQASDVEMRFASKGRARRRWRTSRMASRVSTGFPMSVAVVMMTWVVSPRGTPVSEKSKWTKFVLPWGEPSEG